MKYLFCSAVFAALTACGGGGDDQEPTTSAPPIFDAAFEKKISVDVQRFCEPEQGTSSTNRAQAVDADGRERLVVFAFCNNGRVHYLNYRLDSTLFEHFVGPFGSTQTVPAPL